MTDKTEGTQKIFNRFFFSDAQKNVSGQFSYLYYYCQLAASSRFCLVCLCVFVMNPKTRSSHCVALGQVGFSAVGFLVF